MKLTALARTALFLSAGLLPIAGAQAHFGRPLDDAQCSAAWAMASPKGDTTITYNQAEPYVASFIVDDQDEDGMLSAAEFKRARSLGLVLSPAATTPMTRARRQRHARRQIGQAPPGYAFRILDYPLPGDSPGTVMGSGVSSLSCPSVPIASV